jgi:hypothetical protein
MSSAVSLTPLTPKLVDFIDEYLRKHEAICKKALTRRSGAEIELFEETTRGRKSRDIVPLSIETLYAHSFHTKTTSFLFRITKNELN